MPPPPDLGGCDAGRLPNRMQKLYLLLADAVLITHALIVLFNVASLPLIWLGRWLRWRFVRNFSFRLVHLLLIGYITVQALAGKNCPLTGWEEQLRVKAGTGGHYAGSFIAHWVQRLLFYDAEEWVFTVAYLLFFALVLATQFWVKPDPPRWWREPRKR
jgi:hypothetical protein